MGKISNLLSGTDLTKEARQAVNFTGQYLLVRAGPGTGKTTCISCKAYKLISRDGIDPKAILLLTFTNSAKNKMRDTLEEEEDLKAFLESNIFTQDPNACRVGEFALGTNIYLKRLIGNFTQDEKFPSVHIAFGDPYGHMTGAPWESKIHMDAIVLKPTVWVDGKVIMEEGRYLIEP